MQLRFQLGRLNSAPELTDGESGVFGAGSSAHCRVLSDGQWLDEVSTTESASSAKAKGLDSINLANHVLHRLSIGADKTLSNPTSFSGSGRDQEEVHLLGGQGASPSACPDSQVTSRLQESPPAAIREYLDSCFPAFSQGPEAERAVPGLSLETEYLSVWTVSQAVLLKGQMGAEVGVKGSQGDKPGCASEHTTETGSGSSLELYSPWSDVNPGVQGTPRGSVELFDTLSEQQEEGGVVIEARSGGLLCSQGTSFAKRNRDLDQEASEQTAPHSRSRAGSLTTTLLSRCVDRGKRYRVLVGVLYPCHLKEIKVKSGFSAGSMVPLATIVVTDQSGAEMKVVLWRTTAFWALTVYPGDLLLITDLTVSEDRWRGELVLQSTYTSTLLNLGQASLSLRLPVPESVEGGILEELHSHLREKHPSLLFLPLRVPQSSRTILYTCLGALRPDTLVHALLQVMDTSLITEVQGSSRTGAVKKAVLTVEQGDDQQGVLVLWGSAMAWLQQINRNKGAVWDFRVLLVRSNTTSGAMELHSTPWGSCEPLFPNDKRALEFHRQARPDRAPAILKLDLHTLLSQKYTGDIEVKCQITGLQFQCGSSQNVSLQMNGHTPLQRILNAISEDITFMGCARCGSELGTDRNGIYSPCYPCLPHTAVKRYYRPALLTVKDGDCELCVQVPPVLVQKILSNMPPELPSKIVGPSSDRTFGQVVADTCYSLLSNPSSYCLTLRSHFQLDENKKRLRKGEQASCKGGELSHTNEPLSGCGTVGTKETSVWKISETSCMKAMLGQKNCQGAEHPFVSVNRHHVRKSEYESARSSATERKAQSADLGRVEPIMLGDYSMLPHMNMNIKAEPFLETVHGPYLQIIEEPKQRGFRFRYECEGPSHGGLPGASSEKNKKTYPTVKVCNYVGYARVEVQLVTHTDPPRVHAHSLVGKQCNENGVCSITVGPNDLTAQFNNLGILHVTKRGVMDVLTKRLREERKKLRGGSCHFTDAEEQEIMNEAKELSKVMDLNVVRLKFTAYIQDSDGAYTRALKPAISNPIYDSKSPNASNLKISRMDKTCGSVLGGDEIFLLCDKVQKDDIDIRFYEDEDGGWEAFGDFAPTDVHKQYAIVFKTPQYHSTEIDRPVTVFLQLKRRKGGDCSEPKQFTYVPQVQDKEEVQRKKQKPLPHYHDHWRGPAMGGSGGPGRGPGGFGPGGAGGGVRWSWGIRNPREYTIKIFQLIILQFYDTASVKRLQSLVGEMIHRLQCVSSDCSHLKYLSYHVQIHLSVECIWLCFRLLDLSYSLYRDSYFPFPQAMDGSFLGQFGGFQGGSQMAGLAQPQDNSGNQQNGAPHGGPSLQQQLLQLAALLQSRATQMARRTAGALLDYSSTGDVRMLLAVQRQLCAVQDENGDTPLHLAIIHQQSAVVEQLVQVIISIPEQKILNICNHLLQTPLHLAVITKQHKVVDFRADPSHLDRYEKSVLHLAAPMGDENMLRILLGHLGERHANLLNTSDYSGLYPVHLAVRRGGDRCLRMLVEAGANVNVAERKSGCTALHLAVQQDLLRIACTLVTELKAEVNLSTFGGNTPLHLAASQGSPVLCSMLIAAGAEKRVENDEPLFFSSSSSSDEDDDEEGRSTTSRLPRGENRLSPAVAPEPQPYRVTPNPRKRPARGHTPYDLAKCQRVRDVLESKPRPSTSKDTTLSPQAEEEGKMDGETLNKLCGILRKVDVQWKQLAEKLGMLMLADLYKECPSPCRSLLEGYQLGGGRVEGLVEALEAMGLNEGVRLLRQTELKNKTPSTEVKVDSGFCSHPTEELQEEHMEESVLANS
ncbi:NFKB2 factor, partial [Atractosteus spatula]|nr:NFKB2 factor [Atractosteus spatula]